MFKFLKEKDVLFVTGKITRHTQRTLAEEDTVRSAARQIHCLACLFKMMTSLWSVQLNVRLFVHSFSIRRLENGNKRINIACADESR